MPIAEIATARQRKQELGQFLTPPSIAAQMASFFGPLPDVVRLLDAGAGAGALTLAFVTRVCSNPINVRAINATLFEVDPKIQGALGETMVECARCCAQAGIQFSFAIRPVDFVKEVSIQLGDALFESKKLSFNVALANPPYRKIGLHSAERQSLRHAGIETSNLYTGFIALIHRLLAEGGQLVAITPRSFCNGTYFRGFREDLLANLEIHRLHVFESRDSAFRHDDVLQENIIFHAVKGRKQPVHVTVSASEGEGDGVLTTTAALFSDIVRRGDSEKFIHIPSGSSHATARDTMDAMPCKLEELGISVSTGPVVDFRLKDFIQPEPARGTVPLIYPCHFNRGTVHWPKPESRKPNAIVESDETGPWLIRSGIYLLIKRFTSKEERRRVVACILDPEKVPGQRWGLENHLNYFHANGRGLERFFAYGLYAYLNSTMVDDYFRSFSGHTQVNATDLRSLSYLRLATLRQMGRTLNRLHASQEEIDLLVKKCLDATP